MKAESKIVIGWREVLHLPELGVRYVKAKVDTGARTSALHVEDLEYLRRRKRPWVRFRVLPAQRSTRGSVLAEAPLYDERRVRSSNGHQETRPVIMTDIDIGGTIWAVELTLTSRDEMGFRMLLGRQAMKPRCVVDPGRSFVTRKEHKKKKKTTRRKR